MKFNIVPIFLTTALASTDPAAPDFSALKAETEAMKQDLLRDSKSIDTKLRSIVEHKPEKESLVQLQSMEQLQRNRHKFEEESATLLQANKARVERYRERFDELLAKLREDVSDKNYGSSFIELSDPSSPLDVDQLFAEAKAKVEKLHFVARDIREAAHHWNKGSEVPPPISVKETESSFDGIEV